MTWCLIISWCHIHEGNQNSKYKSSTSLFYNLSEDTWDFCFFYLSYQKNAISSKIWERFCLWCGRVTLRRHPWLFHTRLSHEHPPFLSVRKREWPVSLSHVKETCGLSQGMPQICKAANWDSGNGKTLTCIQSHTYTMKLISKLYDDLRVYSQLQADWISWCSVHGGHNIHN